MTQFEFFLKNSLSPFIFALILFGGSLVIELYLGSKEWYFSFIFLFIAVIIIPIANYFSWKRNKW